MPKTYGPCRISHRHLSIWGGTTKQFTNIAMLSSSNRALAWLGSVWARYMRKRDAKLRLRTVISRPCEIELTALQNYWPWRVFAKCAAGVKRLQPILTTP